MKHCNGCNTDKPTTEFARRGTGLQSRCRSCANAVGMKNYFDNKERYFAQAKARDEALDRLIVARKSVPCTDCGIKYPPYVMQFDHIGDDKEHNISTMRRHRMAFDKIVTEMDKCEVVCANCHAERSNVRNPSTRYAKIVGDF